MTEEYGKREPRSKAPNDSEVTSSCDLGTEPDLRKIGKQGRNPAREIAPSLLCDLACELKPPHPIEDRS